MDTEAEDWGYGYCWCRVRTRAWAKAVDYASADAFGEAYWQTSWQWQGPPSTPPGGTLYWYINAEGSADAWGYTTPGNGGSAYSDAEGYSCAWHARSTGSTYIGGATAYGYVEDNDWAAGDAQVDPEAELVPGSRQVDLAYGSYDCSVEWEMTGEDDDVIASGTSTVSVLGGVACDSTTYASASGAGSGSEASAQTLMEATAWDIEADLTSN